jgi:hypothetical protein
MRGDIESGIGPAFRGGWRNAPSPEKVLGGIADARNRPPPGASWSRLPGIAAEGGEKMIAKRL